MNAKNLSKRYAFHGKVIATFVAQHEPGAGEAVTVPPMV